MDKKMIEKAFMRLNKYMDGYAIAELASVIVESKQAIVIECEVEHSKFHTIVKNEIGNLPNRLVVSEHHGRPGEAIAIILPLEKEDD